MRFKLFITVLLLISVFAMGVEPATQSAAREHYSVSATWNLAADGHWGKVVLDGEGKKLYVLESGKMQVMDVGSGKAAAEIPGVDGPRGMVLVPSANRGFIANGWAKSVSLFDLTTNKHLGLIRTGQDAEGIIFDPISNRVLTTSWAERSIAALAPDIDAKTEAVDPILKLDGRPVGLVGDNLGMVYIATTEPEEMVVLDTRHMAVATTWPLDAVPTGVAMDRVHSRLYVATRAGLLVVSATDGHQIALLPVKTGLTRVVCAGEKIICSAPEGELHIFSTTAEGGFVLEQTLGRAAFGLIANPENAFEVNGATGTLYVPQVEPHDSSWQSRPLKMLVLERKDLAKSE